MEPFTIKNIIKKCPFLIFIMLFDIYVLFFCFSEKVNLLYFNKKEKDILFRSFFDKISKEDSRYL